MKCVRAALGWLFLALAPLSAHGPVHGLDANANGLSDLFERLYPTATDAHGDADRDGMTNAQEFAAGTDPTDPHSRLGFSAVAQSAGQLRASWSSVRGKLYQMQASRDLAGGSWSSEGSARLGNGAEAVAECPADVDRMFLRLTVTDVDSDGDGVTDWEETIAGTDPLDAFSRGDGVTGDHAWLRQLLAGENVVNVTALASQASEAGPVPGTFRISRRGGFGPLIVTFALSGTATPGSDFTAAPVASVFLPAGSDHADVQILPLADEAAEPAESVVLSLQPGSSYRLGGLRSATVTIEDFDAAGGTGLRGEYYDNASSSYESSANFNPLDLKATRVDSKVEFDWGSSRPHPALQDDDYHSVRWTGQVKPAHSELYTFFTQANAAARLWIDGALVIDRWSGSTSVEYSGTVPLQAGRRYDLKMEYYDLTGTSSAYLRWASPSQPKQVIPAQRLYPTGGSAPVITSPGYAVALAAGPFTYQIAATGSPGAFAADGLPAGLSLDPASGRIGGVPGVPPGLYFATVAATNAAGTGSRTLAIAVLAAGGGLSREVWSGLQGRSLQSLPLHTAPTRSETLESFEVAPTAEDQFGERIRGLLTAPATGLYTFFLTTHDEDAELWISASDEPARALKRCRIISAAPGGQWGSVSTQKSLPMQLQAGRRYHIEALRKETSGEDRLRVGWIRPGQADGISPAEIIPGYCLTPPGAEALETPASGSLYIAQMTPQSGAVTLGSGSAVMHLDDERTVARITVRWSNLTGPKTQMHLHDALRGGAIIFDFDDAVPDETGAYVWTLAPTGQHSVDDIRQTIAAGQAFINVHTAQYPAGEIKGFLAPAAGSRSFVPPPPPPAWVASPINAVDAARFLNQATFGLSGADADASGVPDAIEELQSLGYAGWIDRQMSPQSVPVTLLHPDVLNFYTNYPRPSDSGNREASNEIWRFWWKAACTAPDQLRQRVAFALSQILVVSEDGVLDENASALAGFYDLLSTHAFGSFRTLLEQVTLNYGMGRYLDMAGNKKPDPALNRTANENYAREILQLFSIGLQRLHPDGSLVLGRNGLPVDTYDQDVVVGFANTFTGWNNDPAAEPFYRWRYTTPMTVRTGDHHTGEKLLLESCVLPARSDPSADLRDAHDVIFHHPSLGPFLCRQLIQRMVTSNPSPGYIHRVAQKFDDDGTGTRGNLGAVVRAILLDYEARSRTAAQQPGFGHLKEPLLRATQVLRAFKARSMSQGQPLSATGGSIAYATNPNYIANARRQDVPRYLPLVSTVPSPGWDMGRESSLGQTPLRAPTVFNFFEPNYIFAGETGNAGLFGPEFQILSETTIVDSANWFYTLSRSGQGQTTNWDAEAWQTSATASPPTAIDINGTIHRYNTVTVNGVAYPETPRNDTEGPDIQLDLTHEKRLAYSPAGLDTSEALLDHLNLLLMAGGLEKSTSSSNRTTYYIIWNYLRGLSRRVAGVGGATTAQEEADRLARVQDAIDLIVTSPAFNVRK